MTDTQTDALPVLAYLRVSTDQQGDSGLGLEGQLEAITRHVDHKGWRLVEVYQDIGSGRSYHKRAQLNAAMERLADKQQNGDRPRALIVSSLDRLTRSPVDAGRIFDRAVRDDWAVVAIDLNIDTTTAAGELVANVIISLARWESRRIGERTRAALRQAKKNGTRIGRPREMPQDTVDMLKAMRAEGMSYRRIATAMNDQGLTGPRGGRWSDKLVLLALRRYG